MQAPKPAADVSYNDQKQEQDVPEPATKDEPMNGSGQNGDIGQAWNGGEGHDGAMNQYNGHMEEERRGIGIKEDG